MHSSNGWGAVPARPSSRDWAWAGKHGPCLQSAGSDGAGEGQMEGSSELA